MSLNNLLINNTWQVFGIIGTLFTYFLWICPEWNNKRIKVKLTNSTGIDDNIKKFIKNNFKYHYYSIRFLIFAFCILISIGITLMFLYSAEGKPIEDLYDVISLSIPIITFYMLLSGIKECDSDSESNGFKLILNFKIKVLEIFIGFEKKLYLRSIHKIITQWYENDASRHEFAALIVRMSDKSFVDILKHACELNDSVSKYDGAAKSILYEKPTEIMEDYFRKDTNMNVLTNVQQLIDTYFELDNCELYKITNFISNHELACKYKSKDTILESIKSIINNPEKTVNESTSMETEETDKFDSLFSDYEDSNLDSKQNK